MLLDCTTRCVDEGDACTGVTWWEQNPRRGANRACVLCGIWAPGLAPSVVIAERYSFMPKTYIPAPHFPDPFAGALGGTNDPDGTYIPAPYFADPFDRCPELSPTTCDGKCVYDPNARCSETSDCQSGQVCEDGECAQSCDQNQTCFCDEYCTTNGDCCASRSASCGVTTTRKEGQSCGGYMPAESQEVCAGGLICDLSLSDIEDDVVDGSGVCRSITCETCPYGFYDGCNGCSCDDQGRTLCSARACMQSQLEPAYCEPATDLACAAGECASPATGKCFVVSASDCTSGCYYRDATDSKFCSKTATAYIPAPYFPDPFAGALGGTYNTDGTYIPAPHFEDPFAGSIGR